MNGNPLRILVTGGSRGIGLALCDAMRNAGHKVCAVSRSDGEIMADTHTMETLLRCDITSERQVTRLVRGLTRDWGGVDILVNNAAISVRQPVLAADKRAWQRILTTNLLGPALTMKAVLPRMASRGHGIIVNISSLEAVHCTPGLACYAASKAGLAALTQSCAREMAYYPGIIIVGFVPGDIRTGMNPDGSETPETAARRFMALLECLEPCHSGKTYVAGHFLELAMIQDEEGQA